MGSSRRRWRALRGAQPPYHFARAGGRPPARRGGGRAGRPGARHAGGHARSLLRGARAVSPRAVSPCRGRGSAGGARLLPPRPRASLSRQGGRAPGGRAGRGGGRRAPLGGDPRGDRPGAPDAVVQFLRHLEPVAPMSGLEAAGGSVLGAAGEEEARDTAALLERVLPRELGPLFDASFVRSRFLYEQFVHRLVLQVVRETGLEDALRDEGSTEDIALRAKLAAAPALVPLDWILRSLATRGLLAEPAGQGRGRAARPGPPPPGRS